MRLLITGGCGFLGSNLAAGALQHGYTVAIFDNLSRTGSSQNLLWLQDQGAVQFCHGDIRNPADIRRIVQEFLPTTVFHLAGQVAMTTSISNPRLDFETNACGTFNLLEAVKNHAADASVIYSSTNKVYGDLEQFEYRETDTRFECIDRPQGFDETTPLDFRSPYGCSKGAADQYMLDFARIFGLKTVVLRHSSMYGGRQYASFDQGWIGWFIQKALESVAGIVKEPWSISGTGKQVRDVLHAEDMISLYFSVLEHIEAASGKAFNIGGGVSNSLSLLELFQLLEELTGTQLRYYRLPERASDQKVFIADISKACSTFSWQPKIDKITGISRMLEWVQHQLSQQKGY